MNVPEHVRHLPDVSPQLQILAMGFSWAPYFCQKTVESCVRLAGFSSGRLAYGSSPGVDGVCSVGCNRQKVLAALGAVKATLDAAGLQCSEIVSDTSKQVFTGLQLNHETWVLSLEAFRIWRLRLGLELAAHQ